jgi:hypothetical protein
LTLTLCEGRSSSRKADEAATGRERRTTMTTSTGVAGAGSAERSEGGMGGGLLRATVVILILEPSLMFTAFFVLNSSIDWPASLDAPARVNLPLILEQQGAVTLGYGAYLAYSLLVLPLSVMFYFLLKERGSSSPLLAVAAGFGIVSALARALGIGRWLFAMPFLAEAYVAPGTTDATRQTIAVVYDALNEYAGGVGELLGVTLLGAAWIGLTSAALLRSRKFPNWLGILGLLAAVLLLPGLFSVVGLDVGTLFAVIGGNVLLVWMLALAVVLIRASRRNA